MISDKNTLMNHFLDYLTKEFQSDKHLRHVQFERWSLKNFKITIHCFYKEKRGEIFVDLRELKDNQDHLWHLKGNIIDQLNKWIK